jgi:hypothetical protein
MRFLSVVRSHLPSRKYFSSSSSIKDVIKERWNRNYTLKTIAGTSTFALGSYIYGFQDFFIATLCIGSFTSVMIAQSKANQTYHTLGIRSSFPFAILNLAFPSIQEAINAERVITSRANTILRENEKIKEIFGKIERIEGPTMIYAVPVHSVENKELIKVEYKIISLEHEGLVRLMVEFQGMGFYESIVGTDEIVGQIDSVHQKIKIRSIVLKVPDSNKYVDIEFNAHKSDPKDVVVDG